MCRRVSILADPGATRPIKCLGRVPRMTASTIALGPDALGLELGADATVDGGWLVRSFRAGPGLDGPPGVLQGGLAAGITAAIARAADRFGAPLTGLDARLHAPTPLETTLVAALRATDEPARYEVQLRDDDQLLVSATVELAGHDAAPRAHDLAELATVALPEPRPQYDYPRCWVCGAEPTHPHALRLHPRPYQPDQQVVPWVAEELFGDEDGTIDPLVVSAVLDCPTAWVAMPSVQASGYGAALLGGYQLRVYRDAPVMEALRTVARLDGEDGRKLRARGALVDEDGITYAIASAVQIAAPGFPST